MTVGHGGLTSGSIWHAAGLERVVRFDPGDSSGRAPLPVRDERGLEPALAWLADEVDRTVPSGGEPVHGRPVGVGDPEAAAIPAPRYDPDNSELRG